MRNRGCKGSRRSTFGNQRTERAPGWLLKSCGSACRSGWSWETTRASLEGAECLQEEA